MYGKMQEYGLTEIIPFICTSYKTEHRVPVRMKYGASMAHCLLLRSLTNIGFLESILGKGWLLESFLLSSNPNEHNVESSLLG